MSSWPTELRLSKDRRNLLVAFDDGASFALPAELLRVESPSAEVQGHHPSQKTIVAGKAAVEILRVEPVGNYAVRLGFDDMHETGIYAWDYLRELGEQAQEKMKALTQTMAERKVSPELANEVESAKSMVAAREDVIKVLDSGALGRTAGFSSFMVGFAQQARSDLWLTGFRIAAGGDEIEIHGRMLDPTRLPDYVQRLNAVPVFQGRRFAALEMRRVSPDEVSSAQTAQASAVEAAGQHVADGDQAQQQRPFVAFVEFLLRSESVGGGEAPARAKGAS